MNDLIKKRDIDYISAPIAPVLKGEKVHYEYVAFRKQIEDISPVPAIPILEGATNGDVIKAIFSDNVFAEERWQDENGKMCTDVISDNGMTFTDIWWNSPYKRGETE